MAMGISGGRDTFGRLLPTGIERLLGRKPATTSVKRSAFLNALLTARVGVSLHSSQLKPEVAPLPAEAAPAGLARSERTCLCQ
jgi:hypothetical protein